MSLPDLALTRALTSNQRSRVGFPSLRTSDTLDKVLRNFQRLISEHGRQEHEAAMASRLVPAFNEGRVIVHFVSPILH